MPLILKIIIAIAILYGLIQLTSLKDTLNKTTSENNKTADNINQLNYIEDNSTK